MLLCFRFLDSLSIVAGQVVICHSETGLIVFSEYFGSFEELDGIGGVPIAHFLDGEHVADVANLNADFSKLPKTKESNESQLPNKNGEGETDLALKLTSLD